MAGKPSYVEPFLQDLHPEEQHAISPWEPENSEKCINPKCRRPFDDQDLQDLEQFDGYYTCPDCDHSYNYYDQFEHPGGKTRAGLTLDQMGYIGEQVVLAMGEIPGLGPIVEYMPGKQGDIDFIVGNYGVEVKTNHSEAQERFKIGGERKFDAETNSYIPARAMKYKFCQQNNLIPALVGVRLNFYTDQADIFVRKGAHAFDNEGFSDTWIGNPKLQYVGTVNFSELNPFKHPEDVPPASQFPGEEKVSKMAGRFDSPEPNEDPSIFGTVPGETPLGNDHLDETDQQILTQRAALYDQISGPRIGDIIREPDGTYSRITYIWKSDNGSQYQTTWNKGSQSFYLGEGYISYSGGLDPGYQSRDLIQTGELMPGAVWFFHHGFAGAGQGRQAFMEFRVFEITSERSASRFEQLQPQIHLFDNEFIGSGEVYDQTQYDDSIKDGDVLVIPNEGVVGILQRAWPVAITQNPGEFHVLDPEYDTGQLVPDAAGFWKMLEGGKYWNSYQLAKQEADKLGLKTAGSNMTQILPSVFVGPGQEGDFAWMSQQPEYANSLFIFNDNEEQFLAHDCVPGGGNAVVRPLQCEDSPRAAGIPTGSRGRGYETLTPENQAIIDQAIANIKSLAASGQYDRIYYSDDGNGSLGTGIFQVGEDVKDYIVQSLMGGNLQTEKNSMAERSGDPELDMLDDQGQWQRMWIAKLATWNDVQTKAKRLLDSGAVTIYNNGYNQVAGSVKGDHDTYGSPEDPIEFYQNNPTDRSITYWKCQCPWGDVSWGRTRQWKKYEGRVCSHMLALYWASRQQAAAQGYSEDQPSGPSGPAPENPSQQSQDALMEVAPEELPDYPINAPEQPPSQETGQQPSQTDMKPPSVDHLMEPIVQTQPRKPGEDPLSFPGAFSHWQEAVETTESKWDDLTDDIRLGSFQNGDKVRVMPGITLTGKDRDGMMQYIPEGSSGEVLYANDNEVIAIFPLGGGILTPHLVRVVTTPDKLYSDERGTPFVKRR